MERFVVGDDHPPFRAGLMRMPCEEFPDLLVDQADTLQQALELARHGEPPAGLLLYPVFHGQDLRPFVWSPRTRPVLT